MRSYEQFIGGDWRPPASNAWLETVDPATGQAWARIARGDETDADLAVRAAYAAVTEGPWSEASPEMRRAALLEIAALLRDRWEGLVEAEVRDNGKRIAEVRSQFAGLHHWYGHYADHAQSAAPRALDNDLPGVESFARYEPYGVVAAITPWNSPLMIAAWKIAPALAAGNAIVLKPSEHASASTLEFARLLAETALPAGVFNVVTGLGHELGEPLVRHPLVARVSFTGSDIGGQKVAEAAAAGIKPVTLELGGKSPQVVFSDADLENAVRGILSGIFLSNGQTCVAGSRLIVESASHDELVSALVARASVLRAGDPMDPETEIAPLANRPHLGKVLEMMQEAKGAGAHCVLGGEQIRPDSAPNGYFVEPTIFTGVTPDMRLWREEVFGPVLAVTSFESEDEAIALANDSDYGLAAGVWTGDPERGRRIANRIATGTVYINHYRSVSPGTPIGGYKRSGYGRELGPDAVKDCMQTKAIWEGTSPCPDPFPSRRSEA